MDRGSVVLRQFANPVLKVLLQRVNLGLRRHVVSGARERRWRYNTAQRALQCPRSRERVPDGDLLSRRFDRWDGEGVRCWLR